jgi:hypothetical protein
MPVDPTELGNPDFGFQGDPFDPRTELLVQDAATDFGFQGDPHPVIEPAPPSPGGGGGGTVIFMLSL